MRKQIRQARTTWHALSQEQKHERLQALRKKRDIQIRTDMNRIDCLR
jgi:hypothetical protein